MRVHSDHRREAYCDLFPALPGDVNVFVFHAGADTHWHRHQRQTDRFVVVKGSLQVDVVNPAGETAAHFLRAGDEVTIPPNHWHGYTCEEEGTVLVMYLDQKYDPTDEEQCASL